MAITYSGQDCETTVAPNTAMIVLDGYP